VFIQYFKREKNYQILTEILTKKVTDSRGWFFVMTKKTDRLGAFDF